MINWLSFVIGVISSLSAQGAGHFLVVRFWPWFTRKVSSSECINLSGKWISEFTTDDGEVIEAIFTICQNGTSISGQEDGRIEQKDGTAIEHETYSISGEVRDGFVYINSINKKKTELGRLLLLLRAGGKEMRGFGTWYSVRRNDIVGQHMLLKREHNHDRNA